MAYFPMKNMQGQSRIQHLFQGYNFLKEILVDEIARSRGGIPHATRHVASACCFVSGPCLVGNDDAQALTGNDLGGITLAAVFRVDAHQLSDGCLLLGDACS